LSTLCAPNLLSKTIGGGGGGGGRGGENGHEKNGDFLPCILLRFLTLANIGSV